MDASVANKTPTLARTGVRESFVLVAMSLVAVAVGVGLYAQFEAGFLLALLAACIGYVVLLAAHVLVQRVQRVLDLEAEIARLTVLVSQMQRTDLPRELEDPRGQSMPIGRVVRAPRPPIRDEPPPAPSAIAQSAPPDVPSVPSVSIAGYPTLSDAEPGLAPASFTRVVLPPPLSVEAFGQQTQPEGTRPDAGQIETTARAAVDRAEIAVLEEPLLSATEPLPKSPPPPPSGASVIAGDGDAREFETMQVLIQQLAVKLNAPAEATEAADTVELSAASMSDEDPQTPASADTDPDRVAAMTDQVIGQSAAMLRAAADDLRRMDAVKHGPEPIDPARSSPTGDLEAVGNPSFPAPRRPPSPYGRLALIAEAVAADRIDVYLDPILGLDLRRAKHFEVSVKLRTEDHQVLDAGLYRSMALEAGLLPRIDSAKLARTAKVAERLRARGSDGALFSTLDGGSLGDDHFRNTCAGLFEDDAALGARLVLAFAQRDVRAFTRAHWNEIATMSAIGLKFALEEVTDLDMDFEQLMGNGFDFIKLDAKVFLDGLPAPGGAIPAADLCRHLSGLGLTLVVGRIEDERDLVEIVGFGAILGQGALFGPPRPVKVDMVPAQAAA